MPEKFLIAPFKEGLDKELEPWLLQEDAFVEMQDAYVKRGVLQKREGFLGLATGNEGSKPECQSRIVTAIANEAKGNTDGSGDATITLTNAPIREGDVSIDVNGGGETISDNGDGTLTGDVAATGTVNYVTGSITISGSVITSAILVSYNYYPERPVMGLFNYITSTNSRQLVALDTRTFNKYNATTNRFDEIALSGSSWTGTDADFFSFTNYVRGATSPSVWERAVILTNGVNVPQIYDGSTVDDITSATGWAQPPAAIGGDLKSAKLVFYYGNRLVFLNTKQDAASVNYPQRALYSASVISGSAYSFAAIGAGVIDATTDDEIMGAAFLSNALVVFFRNSLWSLKITEDADIPFRWERLDSDSIMNCEAPFSVLNYYNEVNAAGILGLYGTDGNSVGRIDNKLPFFSRDEISSENFKYCYAGFSTEGRQRYLTYPKTAKDQADVTDSFSTATEILVNNVEENTWSTYTIPMHVLGFYRRSFAKAWDDFTDPWDKYGEPWDSYAGQQNTFLTCGGNVTGFVFEIDEGGNDFQVKISGITQANPGVVSTETHTFKTGDIVKISDVSGMTEVNDEYFTIKSVNSGKTNITLDGSTTNNTAYTSGGLVEKAIPFDVKTKPLNPWIKEDSKAHLHWVDFRVSVSGTTTCNIQFFTEERIDPYIVSDQSSETIELNFSDSTGREAKWYRVYVNSTAFSHQIRLFQEKVDDTPKIHAMRLSMSPTGIVEVN